MNKDETKAFTHRMPASLMAQIDEARGHLDRNTYMNMLLARSLRPDKITFTFTREELADVLISHKLGRFEK